MAINIKFPTPRLNESQIAIIPFGSYCNQKLALAKPGDMVSFIKDKKQDVRMIKQITRYRIETAEFTFIMRYVFGENMTISKLLADWQAWSIVEGYGKKGFNRDQCLVLEIC